MTAYKINPVDTLFFRDGKPFSMEDDTVATGLFPPPPSVLYGLLRTAYATGQKVSYETIRKGTSHLKISDLRYSFHQDQYYPAPLDLVIPADSNLMTQERPEAKLLMRQLMTDLKVPVLSSFPYPDLLTTDDYVQGVQDLYIDLNEWQNYLNANAESYLLFNPNSEKEKFFFTERKVGIGKNKIRRVAAEGQLYRIAMQRAVNFGMLVKTNVASNEVLSINNRCGAEGKITQMRLTNWPNINPLTDTNVRDFKIILTSPAFFAQGHHPDFSKLPAFQDFSIEIRTAFVGRKFPIGGFDMVKRRPKPLRFAVPTASIYYCRLNEGSTLNDLLNHPQLPISISEVRAEEGFGLYQLGKIKA